MHRSFNVLLGKVVALSGKQKLKRQLIWEAHSYFDVLAWRHHGNTNMLVIGPSCSFLLVHSITLLTVYIANID